MKQDRRPWRNLYKTARWEQLRATHLAAHPLCAECKRAAPPRITAANTVHHIKPHKGDVALFFDPLNLESACKPCHDGPLQSDERKGFSSAVGLDGWPVSPSHPTNVRK